jgi:hypothetical protein
MSALKRLSAVAVALAFVCAGPAQSQDRVDNSTLNHKFILGFMGWFSCPGDENVTGWAHSHWFNAKSEASEDLLPDVSELPADERCETGMTDQRKHPVEVFSDLRYPTVLRQFEWMRDYHLDGVALQRFVVGISDPSRLPRLDRVLDNVRRAAEASGRVFFVQYDIGGADSRWPEAIEADWVRLIKNKIVDSPAYLHQNGKPVVGVTGPGQHRYRPATPEQTLDFFDRLRSLSAQNGVNVTLFGTVPRDWRTGQPQWSKVFRSFDVISPWMPGAIRDSQQINTYVEHTLKADLAETQRLGIGYMPVVFPGFSWANLKRDPSKFNGLPRMCGRFLSEQATAYVSAGATMLFGAMFDEVGEGTAFFKITPHKDQLPSDPKYVALDVDGCDLPSDWYLRIADSISRLVKNEPARFPALAPAH